MAADREPQTTTDIVNFTRSCDMERWLDSGHTPEEAFIGTFGRPPNAIIEPKAKQAKTERKKKLGKGGKPKADPHKPP